jgi:solute carrier family 35 protein
MLTNKKDAVAWKSVFACAFYLLASLFMVVFNKSVTRTVASEATELLLLWQMSCTVVLLTALESCHCINLEPLQWSSLRRVFPVTLFYVLNVGLSLLAIKQLNLTAYSAVKRLTPICILPLDRVLRGAILPWPQLVACLVMVAGTLLMAQVDETSTWRAYLLGLASCFSQAMYMVLVKARGSANGRPLSSASMLKLNSLIAVPMLLPIVMLSGQVQLVGSKKNREHIGMFIPLVVWPTVGMMLNYALFLCTKVTDPITVTIVGHLKGAILSISGFFVFEGAPLTLLFGAGLALNLCGSLWYMRCQLLERAQSTVSDDEPKQKTNEFGS